MADEGAGYEHVGGGGSSKGPFSSPSFTRAAATGTALTAALSILGIVAAILLPCGFLAPLLWWKRKKVWAWAREYAAKTWGLVDIKIKVNK